MEDKSLPVYTQHFWAKSDKLDRQRIHLLEHHLADVAACFEALLLQPTIRRRLARSGGRDDLDDATAARLAVLAAMHDIGKVNVGFQTQVWRDADFPPGKRPPRVGHTLDLSPVLNNKDWKTADWFFPALGWDAMLDWDDRDGETVCGLFVATLSHHGLPLPLEGTRQPNPAVWRSYGDLNPQEYVKRIGQLARKWFPAAFAPDAPPLPSAPAFQHHVLGLCNLADWLGSNKEWFEFVDTPQDDYIAHARQKAADAIDAVGLNLDGQRAAFASVPAFADLFSIDGGAPNAIQRAALDTSLDERLLIIESETGSGKTEAALWRFAQMYAAGLVDGIYFALPTRAAAVQIHGRVNDFIARLFPNGDGPEPVLAVPGYLRAGDATGRQLHDYQVWWDDHAGHDARRWAAESSKRYLTAQIAVGAVDQAMLGALQVKNAHLRTSSLARNLLVVDEVHASDVYMGVILESLLDAHIGAGGYALLMSATLGATARWRWLQAGQPVAGDRSPSLDDAIATPYPAVSIADAAGESVSDAGENGQEKTVGITAEPAMRDFDAVAQRALTAARAGAKVLIVRNTVGYAVQTQQAVEELAGPDDARLLFSANDVPALHHGRFAAGDRRLLDAAVERRLGKERQPGGGIVVGTQTLEQSLDIDADLLITDLCPVDVLLQRIGRLHRHRRDDRPDGYQSPVCVVLAPPGDDLSPLLASGQNANGLGPGGYVYQSLHILEATRRLIAEHPQWRIPEMNRLLVENATHPTALESITQEMGLEWKAHAISNEGGYIADRQTARNHVIKFDKSFCLDNQEVCFPGNEERIRTRLGDDRVDITLDPPPSSPFNGAPIDGIALSVRWLGDAEAPDSVEPTPGEDGFEFSIGDRKFRYDRLGLQRA